VGVVEDVLVTAGALELGGVLAVREGGLQALRVGP